MIRKKIAAGALAVAGVLLLPCLAGAHERDFTLLRDWMLPYAGEREIEYRMTHAPNLDFWAHDVEFEYGVNKHFAIEPGVGFVQEDGGKLHVDGYDMEFRFSFGEFKKNVFLPALNVEIEHPVDDAEDDHAELKFIASRYGDDGSDLSINLNVGWALGGARERESELAIGYMRPAKPGESRMEPGMMKYGLEFLEGLEEHHAVLGPTIAYRVNEHLHMLGTFAFGLNSRDDNTFKMIAEWEF